MQELVLTRFFSSHLAIVLVHTVRNVQDPIHLYIVWVKRLLILQKYHTVRDQ